MSYQKESLASHLTEGSKIGEEISITGKWVPLKKGGIFRKSSESKEMLKEWEDIHTEARNHEGILSTEINHAVGQDAVLIHHVFKNEESLLNYFSSTASEHAQNLMAVAKPDIHLVRGMKMSDEIMTAIRSKNVPASFGEYLYGFVKNNYKRPNPENAIQVTAKWTAEKNEDLEELIHWWSMVGKDAFTLEEGLVRFEAYQVPGESALIIHESFATNEELQFHLSKGTAEKYKKNLDKIAAPENYFFRGPVSWMIRTYSKFLHLPATYSSQGSHFTAGGGNMSDGLI